MNETYQLIWDKTKQDLKESIDENMYDELFNNINKIHDFKNGFIYIIIDQAYKRTRIERFFLPKIEKIANNYSSEKIGFKFVLKEDVLTEPIIDVNTPEINLTNKYREGNIDRTLSFDNFVVGKSNIFATKMAMKVADQLGIFANPLYIFGNVGLGKTHLMEAIGNFIIDKDVNKKVLYIKASVFADDYSKSSKNKTFEQFQKQFENLDALLIDDIQMLNGRDKSQQEFFKIFDSLFNDNKQIVITSDRPATELNGIMDRLTSRFSQGLSVDIAIPDLEHRVAILKKKLESILSDTAEIDDAVLELIATNFTSNIRELEGGLKRVIYYTVANNIDITVESAKEALEELIKNKMLGNKLTQSQNLIEKIQSIVSDFYKVNVSDIIGKNRKQIYTVPRHISMYLIKSKTNLTYKQIGDLFSGRDHSTVLAACEKIENDIKNDTQTKLAIESINKKLGN